MLHRAVGFLWLCLLGLLINGPEARAWSLQAVAELPAEVAAALPATDSSQAGRNQRQYFRLVASGSQPLSGQQYLVLQRDRGQHLRLFSATGALMHELQPGAAPAPARAGVRGVALPLPIDDGTVAALYVAIDSVLGVQPIPSVETTDEYYLRERSVGAYEVALGSALLMLIVLSLAFSLILREPGYLVYVAFLVLMLLTILLRHPLSFRLSQASGLAPEQTAALGVLVSALAALASVTLLRAASGMGALYPRGSRAMQWIALVGILFAVVDVATIRTDFQVAQWAFDGVNLCFGANALLSAVLLLATARFGGRTARLFLLGWTPMVLVGGWFSLGGLLGLAQAQNPHRWVMFACLLQGIGWAVALGDRALSLQRERDRARALAELDALTGLPNRRMLDRELAEARSGWLLICDLDSFKAVNDRYGHAVGDRCLVHFAQCLRESLAGAAVFGRYGGEEFLAIVPGGDLFQARLLAERLRERTASTPVFVGEDQHRLTVSIGIAELDPADPVYALGQADRAMYQAKAGGRNRVETAAAMG
ncbi:MAG: diguanylate cyclase [Lysobacterales bacterium]